MSPVKIGIAALTGSGAKTQTRVVPDDVPVPVPARQADSRGTLFVFTANRKGNMHAGPTRWPGNHFNTSFQ